MKVPGYKGSIRQHGAGWEVRVPVKDALGRRGVEQRTVATRMEAERLVVDINTQLVEGRFVARTSRTLAELLDAWLASKAVEASTQWQYESLVSGVLKPNFGHIPVQQLTSQMVQDAYQRWRESGTGSERQRGPTKASTVAWYHSILKQALSWAVKQRWVAHNVALDVQLPRRQRPRKKFTLSLEQRRAVHAWAEECPFPVFGPIIQFLNLTGVRVGEALALRRGSVDFEAGTVEVEETRKLVRGADGRGVEAYGDTKTHKQRTVDVPPKALDVVRRALERQPDRSPDAFVFCDGLGGPLRYAAVWYVVKHKLCPALNLPGFAPHTFRHTWVTDMLAAGESPADVAALAGHTVETMLRTYAWAVEKRKREVAHRLSDRLFGVAR